MINAKQFRELIVRPVLHGLGMWNEYAEELMMGTAAVESQLGTYLAQINGPAVGIFQMEPLTHDDIWQKWLPANPAIAANLLSTCSMARKPSANMMAHDLYYACAMARIEYFRNTKDAIPATLDKQAEYWVSYYNRGGKGTVEKYLEAYNQFVAGGVNHGTGKQQPNTTKPKSKN